MAADLGTVLAARLQSWADLAALVGDRITPNRLTQGEDLPAVVWSFFGGAPINVSTGPSGTVNREIRVQSMGRTYAESKQVAAAVEAALSGWTDDVSGLSVSPVLLIAERDEYELIPDAGDQPVQLVVQDFSVWYA
jgi:hypothetical protein